MQQYLCRNCSHQFNCRRKTIKKWVEHAYHDYSVGKHTLKELKKKYGKSISTIKKCFEKYYPCSGEVKTFKEAVNLVFDGTFFDRDWGVLVFRTKGKNIYWRVISSEKIEYITQCLNDLKNCNYVFKSFTIDGRRGVTNLLKRMYPDTPIQFCQFHQVAIVRRYNTNNPKTKCGIELKDLVLTLTKSSRQSFTKRLNRLQRKYSKFLKERNDNNQFMHQRLRSAFKSLNTNLPYLFTFLDHPKLNIPNTTNSCDGSFSHWKRKVKIHTGLAKHRRLKMINYLLENS